MVHALERFKSIEKSPAMHGSHTKATRPFLESNLGMGPRNKIPLFTPNICITPIIMAHSVIH